MSTRSKCAYECKEGINLLFNSLRKSGGVSFEASFHGFLTKAGSSKSITQQSQDKEGSKVHREEAESSVW